MRSQPKTARHLGGYMSESEFPAAQGQYRQTLRTSDNEGLLSAIVNQTTVGVAAG